MSVSGIVVVIIVEMQGFPATIIIHQTLYHAFVTDGGCLKKKQKKNLAAIVAAVTQTSF